MACKHERLGCVDGRWVCWICNEDIKFIPVSYNRISKLIDKIDDEWIKGGNYSEATVVALRDAVMETLGL